MAIKIRLRRMGRKKQAHYRIVVADSDSPRDGRFVESLGYYKPLSHPARVVVDMDRVDHWIGKGAQPTETVSSLLSKVRKGGDAAVAVGEVDKDAEKKAHLEALAAKRKAEAQATTAEKTAEAPAAEAAPAPVEPAEAEGEGDSGETEAAGEPKAEASEEPTADENPEKPE